MGNSAPAPPGIDDVPEGEEVDETEMTSIMDASQRRELQEAARAAAKEAERETARPPPEALLAVEAEVVIPRAAAVPAEAIERDDEEAESAPAPAPRAAAAASSPAPSITWAVVAFVLLAAAIVFEMR
jgi:hypothetical protein